MKLYDLKLKMQSPDPILLSRLRIACHMKSKAEQCCFCNSAVILAQYKIELSDARANLLMPICCNILWLFLNWSWLLIQLLSETMESVP